MLTLLDAVALSLLPAAARLIVAAVLKGDLTAFSDFPPLVRDLAASARALDAAVLACGQRLRTSVGSVDALRTRAESLLAMARARNIDAIGWPDPTYPAMLRAIDDPPPVLWSRGRGPLDRPAVAIVGSRAASPYATEVAERLAFDLARFGLCIVSGLARGVDAAAHRGALAAGGTTLAVLGSGVDIIYPEEHARLAGEIQQSGRVLSELPAETPPRPGHFPRRNRILSGLAHGVVVVEAAERSGSLITAGCALQQGREVMAVPGNVLSGRHRGAHALLKDGAALVESAQDVLMTLGISDAASPASTSSGASGPRAAVVALGDLDHLLRLMPAGEECELDLLAARGGLAAAELLPKLLELELAGFVMRTAAGRFVRAM